jgi:hypothetical protein
MSGLSSWSGIVAAAARPAGAGAIASGLSTLAADAGLAGESAVTGDAGLAGVAGVAGVMTVTGESAVGGDAGLTGDTGESAVTGLAGDCAVDTLAVVATPSSSNGESNEDCAKEMTGAGIVLMLERGAASGSRCVSLSVIRSATALRGPSAPERMKPLTPMKVAAAATPAASFQWLRPSACSRVCISTPPCVASLTVASRHETAMNRR